jgi:PAS domain S-box-containing protein
MEVEGEKIRILLIEDNPGDARLIRELLTATGSASFVLEDADRLSAGQARLAQGGIDVILLDLSLPDSQGLNGLAKICAQSPKVPVVVLSGLSDEAVALNAVQEGAQDYLVKGKVDSDILVRSLRYAIERQHLRVALSESEARYRLLADNAVDVIWTANMKWQITYVSPSIKRLLGYTVAEMKRLAIKDILTADSLKQAGKLIRNQMDIMTPGSQYPTLSLTLEHVRKDGSTLWAEVTLSFLWDKDGKLSEVLGVTREITERKKAEQALRESEQRYRLLAENVKDIIWTRDLNLSTTYVSPSVTQMSGYSVEEVMSLSIEESMTPASLKIVQSALSKAIAEVKELGDLSETIVLDVELIHKAGSITPVEMKISLLRNQDGQPIGFLGVTRDITERKKAEEALRESEEELQAIFDSSMNGIALLDLEGRVIRVNKRVLEVGGYDTDDLSGKTLDLLKMFTPESIERMFSVRDMILSGKESAAFECELYTKSGKKMSLEINVGPFLLKGQLFGLVAVMRDITERKRMEDALRASEERHRLYFENASDVIYSVDPEGTILSMSPAVERLLGYKPEELIGKNMAELNIVPPEKLEQALIDTMRALAGERILSPDGEFFAKDGSVKFGEISSAPIFSRDGKVIAAICVARDVTERKKMEEELRRLSDAVRMSTDSIVISDLDGNIVDVNEATVKIQGANSKADLIGLKSSDFIAPEEQEKALRDLSRLIEEGYVNDIEYHIATRDGRRILVETNASIMRGRNGEPTGVVAITRDITERKHMEGALKENEERFRAVFEGTGLGIALVDMKTNILGINPAFQRLLGYSLEEFRAIPNLEYLHPEDAMADAHLYMEMLKGERDHYTIDKRYIRKDGGVVWARQNLSVVRDAAGKPIYFIAMIEDITQRKLMEEALRQSEHNYRVLFEGTIDGMLVTDAETIKVVLVNQTAARMCGFNSVKDATGGNPIDLVHPDDRERVLGFFIEDAAGEGNKEVHEFRAITKDGREIWLSGKGTRIEYGGKPAVLSSIRDITQHKKAEKALKESEEKFRSVAETASDAIISLDSEGSIVFWNKAAETIFGYLAQEVMGKPLSVIMPQRFHDIHEKAIKRVLSTGERRLAGKTIEVKALRKDGNEFPMEFTVAGWQSGDKIYSTAIARDITERREMERQLQLAGRLAAVGELAAGVAHELNNPIAAIQGFAQFLAARKDLDTNVKKDLDTIYRESQRAAKITQNLLSFARRHEPEKHSVSLNEVIEKTLELQAHPMQVNNIELVLELAPDLPKTLADFHQMQQVFVNIMNNAEQAMVEANGKGKLVIKTKKSGNIIQISFADNGPGISEENMKRIFDPFFTTKEVGKGTGLGLSICYGLVEAHGGRIYARSKPGLGATFVVELPIASENELVAEAVLLKPGSRGVKWKKQKGQY